MTISVWRYSHLILAVSSFLFLTLAALTGVILSFEPISEKLHAYRAADFDQITLAQTLPVIRKTYPDITGLSVDANQFVQIDASDADGKNLRAYIEPRTARILGMAKKKSEFFDWVRSLHRSLFLHNTGRFFVGLTAFLLLLIAVSGTILIIQRQRGLKRFFARIVHDNFAQYYHVVLGRFLLIPILIIAVTGTYLSLVRFGVLDTKKTTANIDFDTIKSKPERNLADIGFFKNTKLSEVESIEFPFSEDAEDYYTIKLRDREVSVNQVTGDILSEINYPKAVVLSNLSLDLHTGRASAIWAIILAIASCNILFFIYSGFAMTLKRRANRFTNKYKAGESRFVILVGSENGSTFRFAAALHKQLLSAGLSSHLAELNSYAAFSKAEHLIIFAATHGLGDAPTNAAKFTLSLEKHIQRNPINISVVGFGSRSYPDFCGYAYQVQEALALQSWAVPFLDTHTVNDKSVEDFGNWAKAWSEKAGIPLLVSTAFLTTKPAGLSTMTVVEKTEVANIDYIFTVKLRPGLMCRFSSGDLLAVYPHNDAKERFYSIGKINRDIQLIVKLYPEGAGSSYLHQLEVGQVIRVRLLKNQSFHFPNKASVVAMLANGTGIAPFLGMLNENGGKVETHLYGGFRTSNSLTAAHVADLNTAVVNGKLHSLNLAISQEGERQRITHLITRDQVFFAGLLRSGGTIMICGSLAMQNDVLQLLSNIALEVNEEGIHYYQTNGQILTDCY